MAVSINYIIEAVRTSCMDDPTLNELTGVVEFDEKQIVQAIKRTTQLINMTPPILRSLKITLDNFDENNVEFLLDGIVSYIYESKALLEKRNEIELQEQGFVVRDEHRYSDYMNYSRMKREEFTQNVRNVKSILNEEAGFGEVPTFTSFIGYAF